MADRPSMPHPAVVPSMLLTAAAADSGDELRRRLQQHTPFVRRYRHRRQLARGRMSELGLYRDNVIGRAVAIKTLSAEQSGDRRAELRFLREATIQGQLEHPAIVPVYDIGVDPKGSIYFTMKRVRGINLDEILDGLSWGRDGFAALYSRRRLLQALANVSLAVDFAHRRGIIHRDLKPSNIMLGDFGEVYVLDWGLARISPEIADDSEASGLRTASSLTVDALPGTLPGTLLGTPGYMAPEQLGSADGVSPSADVYALGAILFELLTGSPLHNQESATDAVRTTISGPAQRPSERSPELMVPPELDALCARALRRDPTKRIQSARVLHDAIESHLAGEHDLKLRRELAGEHMNAARIQKDRKKTPHERIAGHRRAIRELGRALALDPGNERATNALLKLLAEVPSEIPEAVEEATTNARQRYWRSVARFSGFVYLSTILYAPLILWSGAVEPTPVVFFYLLIALASALSFWVSRQQKPSVALTLTVCGVSNLAFATLSGLAGPLLLTPMILTLNAGAFALLFGRRFRWWILSAGLLAIAGPLALEFAGILSPSYEFIDGAMLVHPRMLQAEARPTLVFLAVAAFTSLTTATLLFSELRELVIRSERRFYHYAWQLRQLLPGKLH